METETVKKLLGNLGNLVDSFTGQLKDDVLAKTLSEALDEISRKGEMEQNEAVSELQQAKLLNMYAYLLVSIYFTSLKLNGSKINNESVIMQEIQRVKQYTDRVKRAEESLLKKEEGDALKEEESERFIKRHLGGVEPAVSSEHFQDRKQNSHVRFESGDDIKKLAEQKKLGEAGNRKQRQKKPRKPQDGRVSKR